jgi:hypothetical protein
MKRFFMMCAILCATQAYSPNQPELAQNIITAPYEGKTEQGEIVKFDAVYAYIDNRDLLICLAHLNTNSTTLLDAIYPLASFF